LFVPPDFSLARFDMKRVSVVSTMLVMMAATFVPSQADAKPKRPSGKKGEKQQIVLDGMVERVNWSDGDSFRIIGGSRDGQKARLVGYNTVESYGPVHFWGDAHGWDIYRIHKEATDFVRSEEWDCESDGAADSYGRILVLCKELRRQIVRKGLAHVYAYGSEEADPELLKEQFAAQNDRLGMWKWGVPRGIVTSVHSIDEKRDDLDFDSPTAGKKSYNRIADTATGKTFPVEHDKVFKPCDVFCYWGSCMLFIPFKMRYGDEKPACVIGKGGELNKMDGPNHLTEPFKQ
jgi:micrococcal nuclease